MLLITPSSRITNRVGLFTDTALALRRRSPRNWPTRSPPSRRKRRDLMTNKAVQVARGVSESLCIFLLFLSCDRLSAENEDKVQNIVLVHGAWADGSGWKGVC